MQLGGILQRLKTEGVLLTYIDFRSGSFHDWSENGRDAIAPAAGGSFTKKGLQSSLTASTITNDATLQAATTGTLITRVRLTSNGNQVTDLTTKGAQLTWKYSSSSSRFTFKVGADPQVVLNISGLYGMFTCAVEFDGVGGTPKGYLNGALLGSFSGVSTVVGAATNISFAYNEVADEFTKTEYYLYISRKLTAAEHSELYTYLQSIDWPNKVYSKVTKTSYVNDKDTSLVRNINGPVRSGSIADSCSISNLIAIAGSSNKDTLLGNMVKCYPSVPAGYNTLGAYPTVNNQPFTVCIIASEIPFTGGNVLVHSAQAAGGGACGWLLAASPTGVGWVIQCNIGATATYSYPGVYAPNKSMFISAKVDPSTPIFGISIDGVPYSTGRVVGSYTGFGNAGLLLGGRTNNDGISFNGLLGGLSIYSELKSDAWVRQQWVKIAQAAQFKTDWGCKESLASENTVGAFVGNGSTPFEILSGTWTLGTQVVNGELHKVIRCVSAGSLWLDRKFFNINSSEASYGSWRLVYGHTKTGANTARISLTSTIKGNYNTAGNTGYVVTLAGTLSGDRLSAYNAGALTTVLNMNDSLKPTSALQITRRFDNSWQGYETPNVVTDPQVTAPWAPSADGPAVNASYVASAGMCFALTDNDWISLGNVRGDYAITKFLGEFDPREV